MANPNIAIWTDAKRKLEDIDVTIATTMSEITIVVHRITSGQIRFRVEASCAVSIESGVSTKGVLLAI